MSSEYIPKKGDIVMIDLNPQAGHEESKRRPALVVSNDRFHELTCFCMVCPITNTDNGFPLHVGNIKDMGCTQTEGYILTEQLKSLDYKARNVKFKEKAPDELLEQIESYINTCLF